MTEEDHVRFEDIPASPAHPWQNMAELRSLWEHVAARPHAFVVEIGSLLGGTLWYWSHLPAVDRLVSVDLPTTFGQLVAEVNEARPHWPEWFGPAFHGVAADSQDPATVEVVTAGRPSIDFLFIDGDHSYRGIRRDFDLWSPHVRPGGVIAFHDTWPNRMRAEPGVAKLVDELRYERPSLEWTDPDGAGITAFEAA